MALLALLVTLLLAPVAISELADETVFELPVMITAEAAETVLLEPTSKRRVNRK